MTSLSLIVAADRRGEADALMEALGHGPGTFSVPLSPTGIAPATHFGCHLYGEALAAIFAAGDMPDWIAWHAVEDRESTANFAALCQRLGVQAIREDEE